MTIPSDPDELENDLPELSGRMITFTQYKETVEDIDADKFKRPFSHENLPVVRDEQFTKILANSTGKVRSQQFVEGESTIYDVVDVVEPVYNMEALAGLYDSDPFHAGAVDALVDNIVGLGYYLDYSRKAEKVRVKAAKKGQDQKEKADERLEDEKERLEDRIDDFNQTDSFYEILYKVAKDRFTMGNGYLEIGRNLDGSVGYLGHIPAQGMRIRRLRDGYVQYVGKRPIFFRNFGDQTTKNPFDSRVIPNEIIHYKKYSPVDNYYGVPEVVSAIDAIAGNRFATQYNIEYFENKAVPRYIVKTKGVRLSLEQKEELAKFFESLKGVHHRVLIFPLPNSEKSDLILEPVETGKQEASFTDYTKVNVQTILARHRVPLNRLGVTEGSSLAGSRDADKIFRESVCSPEQRVFEKMINRILKELTQAFVFKLTKYTLTDEDQQSIIDERDMKSGALLPDERRTKIGLPPRPDGNGDEPLDLRALQLLAQESAEKLQTKALASQEKTAAMKPAPTAPGAKPAAKKAAPAKKAAGSSPAQKKSEQKVAGRRAVDSKRSAGRSNAAQAPGTRNTKGDGRKTP